jgi:predicted membrane-bound spermidine synthase
MLPLSAAAFFASGFAALLYQVIWQRLLVLFSGADLYSVTIIVASFMGGMGVGHLAGGHVADRVSPRTSLLCFAGAELAIAVFGFFSRALYYDALYNRFGATQIPAPALALLLFTSLLIPTFFMGASLPLLSRAVASRLERAASVIGILYGVNTLGAATGALVSTWVLLPWLGLEGGIRVGVLSNVLCALIVLRPAMTWSRGITTGVIQHDAANDTSATEDSRWGPPSGGPSETSFPFWVWACIFATSGLLALALEIVWFRVLAVTMKGTAFTFGTLLGVYLTGLGVGALAGSAVSTGLRRPAVVFLAVQAAIGALAVFLLTAFIRFADNVPALWAYLGSYEPLDIRTAVPALGRFVSGSVPAGDAAASAWRFLALYVALPAALVLPPTLLMGFSFPVLQRVVQTSLPRIGRRVGVLLLANVIGSMAGTALTGFVLLDRVGTAGTMRMLVVVSGGFAVLAIVIALHRMADSRVNRLPAVPAALLGAALLFVPLLVVMPPSATLWAHLHGTVVEAMMYAEDGSGLSVVNTDGRNAILYANGIGQGSMPYGDMHTALGALPAFIHPAPRTAAVIGLGSGDTVHAVAGRAEISRVTCVEIIRGELKTLEKLRQRFPYGGLLNLMDNQRVEQVFGDGRIHLRRGGTYDIIEADALRPGSAYSGALYSDTYFQLVREHLTPNGLAATWAPTQRVYNTFIRAFPYVVAMPGILIGSNDPIPIDRAAIDARLAAPEAHQYFEKAGINIQQLLTTYLDAPVVYTPEYPRQQLGDINTDLFPKDEFDLSPR